jgi:hypothetical protein
VKRGLLPGRQRSLDFSRPLPVLRSRCGSASGIEKRFGSVSFLWTYIQCKIYTFWCTPALAPLGDIMWFRLRNTVRYPICFSSLRLFFTVKAVFVSCCYRVIAVTKTFLMMFFGKITYSCYFVAKSFAGACCFCEILLQNYFYALLLE